MNARSTKPALSPGPDSREATILVVESNALIGRELVEQLRADRYHAALAHTAEHARAIARGRSIRAIVLGTLDSPRGALDLLEEVRRSPDEHTDGSVWDGRLPAIVLSPGATQLDLLRAFEMGADDFFAGVDPVERAGRVGQLGRVGPPYLELRARLRAVLRRAESLPDMRLLRVGSLEIDTGAHQVRAAGVPVELCRLEYELLVHLARNPNGVCSKHELLRAIWNQHAGTGARTVDSHASRLRRKLDAAGAGGLVVNVWGVGYRLV
jgi:DNA-binding response OmpR family regulator